MVIARRLIRAFGRGIGHAVPTVLGILIVNFLLLQLAPGDAADVIASEAGAATAETMAALRTHFGLDQPVLYRLASYILNLGQFSLGVSPRYNVPVVELILARLPNTLSLMGTALVVSLGAGIILGSLMAAFAGRLTDRVLSVVTLLFYSIPSFWIGLMLVVVFSVKLGLLPSGGVASIARPMTGMDAIVDWFRHLVLPATALALFFMAIYARLTRATMLEVRDEDYVRTAEAKGLSPYTITRYHVLRNALLPVTTMAGVHLGAMLGGAIVIETVFNRPGMGRLAFESVLNRDFNVLLGVLLFSSLLVIIANILVDLLHAWLDPRIETR
ncbi:Putative peptide transport system permease protein BAB2_1050 [Hyphomicrobiales bacterium]|nr:Putative peptide transport system permease protein BAB2_1050 [Hyphomicrobiales bacterium]CAH1694328.1 putative peptide transport system permease protein BAB2_1050 [Hyphomicrobiales bacterium]